MAKLRLALSLPILLCTAWAPAQTAPAASTSVASTIDSGWVANLSTVPATQGAHAVVWSQVIWEPGAAWLRLEYEGVLLSGSQEPGGKGSFLRITGLLDGAAMTQHGSHVVQWRNTSAYFNGPAVRIEILARPGTGNNRLTLKAVTKGEPVPVIESICGPTDDRVLSSDPRVARNQPTGCTSWMINDCSHCFLTAGHCTGGLQVVEFNVPLSTTSGSLQHPSPSHQYSVDSASLQGNGGQGIGNDWAYFGVFANSTTGMTPYQAQGQQAFNLAPTPPAVSGQNIRITGYGTTSTSFGISPTWNQAQKTHAGPYFSFSGTTVRYTTDTSGGNSGSPVINDSTGNAIGIHTHAGCLPANHGTGSNHGGLQAALANPQGVCDCPGLTFTYPGGLPAIIDPAGTTVVRVQVGPDPAGINMPQANTGMLHYDTGSGAQSMAMVQVSPNVYDATFPGLPCGVALKFWFSAQSTTGATFTDPTQAPAKTYDALVTPGLTTIVAYDFNSAPPGWTVQNVSLTTGAWVRATPAGNGGARSDPPSDFDGSGLCWVTGNAFNEDVDGGPTRLLTEIFDLSAAADPRVSYARWMKTSGAGDRFVAEVTDNGGSTWILLESVGDTAGWTVVTFPLTGVVANFSQVQFRFSVTDNPNNSVTEGGLDAFQIIDLQCAQPSFTLFGQGCPGSSGTPTLQGGTLPALGTTFQVVLSNLPMTSPASYMALGFSNTVWNGVPLPTSLVNFGLPGCTGYISVDDGRFMPNFFGFAVFSLPLPPDPALAGLTFYMQGISFDANAPYPVKAAVSNAAEVVIQ